MSDVGHQHDAAESAAARLAGIRPPARPVAAAPAAAGRGREKAKGGAAAPGDDDAAKKKKKLRTRIIAAVVLLLVAGYVAKGQLLKPHYGPGKPPPAGAIVSLGSVTTNLSDGHLAQIAVSLQLTAAANAKLEAQRSPALVGSTVSIRGQQTYSGLLAPGGRSHLAALLLRSYQQVLGTNEGGEQVSKVYFTSFVLQ